MNYLDFPKSLIKKAKSIADELAWKKKDAYEVVEFLKTNSYAVLGIEIWEIVENAIRVQGWSEYNIVFDGNWNRFIETNAQCALLDIEKAEPNELINITYVNQNEFKM